MALGFSLRHHIVHTGHNGQKPAANQNAALKSKVTMAAIMGEKLFGSSFLNSRRQSQQDQAMDGSIPPAKGLVYLESRTI
ncbi:hypothetical protein FF124_01050 [Martelella lutilitoris]|uniref:Uncharacterized protein n=1 Tax=Martelella lutilitoris TaxID=2583532 RepID=A0A5C4JY87_9HYPH|nr:hypothetical protein [Martelella lutilitoris]TNB49579.1 hypothetical protein FF124_01050 [Martelella lutilitoris]